MKEDKPLKMREALTPDLRRALERIRDNFLICMVKRVGGQVELPVQEVDAANDLLTITVDQRPTGAVFNVKIERRQ